MPKKASTTRKPSSVSNPQKLTHPKQSAGAPFNDHDPKRRTGNFSGAGEHPHKGGRTAGIVGQTKQRNHTDKNS